MHYVILRDDDTNAFTPVECLERLYRPFLERGLQVNLATIPNVRTDATSADNLPEGFLFAKNGTASASRSMTDNPTLVAYLRANPGYNIVQHGYDHSLFEFDSSNSKDIARRLDAGARLLADAGFPWPQTFVAPYDKFSRTSLSVAAQRYRVISSGWFELRRLPFSWWPGYALKKMFKASHWRMEQTALLSHPGCLLSYKRNYPTMLDEVKHVVTSRQLTVLVTHWWEYFRTDKPDEDFIGVLHATASWLTEQRDVRVISFEDLAKGKVPLS